MKLGRFDARTPDGPTPRLAVLASQSDEPVDVRSHVALALQRRGASPAAATRLAAALVPGSLTQALEGGEPFLEALDAAAADVSGDATVAEEDRIWIAPLDPPSFREFMAFAEHFETVHRNQGRRSPDVLYELPVSYMGNAQGLIGPDEEVPWPHYSARLDYELELGVVVGLAVRDVMPERALDHVFGVTVLNDFSARDIQMREMAGGLGPSKGKHFASAVGPWVATLDAIDVGDLQMRAGVNGETWSSGSTASMTWSIEELLAWASAGEHVSTGALIGSGTVGSGCGLEVGRGLEPGDVVELEIEGIGTLRNRIGRATSHGYMPRPRAPVARGG